LRKVHTSEIHLWKICHQQWKGMAIVFSWKTYQGRMAYILDGCARVGNSTFAERSGEIDARESYF